MSHNPSPRDTAADDILEVTDLIEDISIDGMCGVY